jgi:hypothetical protein
MTRPTRITVNNGDISWESQLNTNLQQLYDTPIPILLHANTLANLQTTRPAASYAWCMAIVDYDGGTTPGSHLAFSNGTAWKLASNWEFMHRRTFRGITTTDSFGDTDETIVVTGASSFALTLPAVADSNEGRVCRVKNNGTGTVTITPTGGDTIDGAATKVSSTQYDAFEFISDGTSNWQIFGASGAGGGASVFTSLTDTPANYTGAANKFVKVNGTPDALVFATAAFTDLSDTPANYTSAASKTVKVNSGGTALEFVDQAVGNLGGPLKYMSRGHVAADTDQTIGASDTTINLPTLFGSAGTAISWVDANDEFKIHEAGTYMILTQVVSDDASSHNIVSFLERDPGGGYAIVDQTTSFQGFTVRNNNAYHCILELDVDDLIRVRARDLSSVSPVAREGTACSIVKLDVTLTGGGDMECFQQGLDASETSALTTGSMVTVDLQSNIINNATDLYTFSAANDDVTLNEAGVYLISYTCVANQTVATLVTQAKLQKDIGAGFVDIDGSQSQHGNNGVSNYSHGNAVIISLDATDKVRLQANDVTGDGNLIAGTMLRIIRLKRGSTNIDYSTTAQKTGEKWIDGKDIWRKVISSTGAVTAGSVQNFAHSISSYDRIVRLEGHVVRDDTGTSQYPVNYPQGSAEIHCNIDDTNIQLFLNSAYTGVGNTLSDPQFIIDYTI